MGEVRCHSLQIKFSLVMSCPGGPGMVNGQTLPQNSIQHHDSYVVIFGAKKNPLTGVRSRVRESIASQLI